ncbi:hypothetical protein J2X97_002796 [Epilithonimonas hungarica]|uniref:hypothetical protein n=1 Tax=Epilithonimonas hungarica TaxID=454006 RepID=UPI002784B329|nr:hypothetical protein [Epilithonimonas hungarica]MDP9957130.1 hypothetical protein [Epilithonimonas hungarica]
MRIALIILSLLLVSCNKRQTQSEIFQLSKNEVFKYLQKNNLLKDSSEIKRETQKIEYPQRDIGPNYIKYYIKNKADSLWIIHAYKEEYLQDGVLFIRLSPNLKKIIEEKEKQRPIPKYDRIWTDGVYEF